MDRDRRESERLPILGTLHGEVMVYQPMAITEVALGGLTIETSFPLHLDSLHDLRLTLSDYSVVVKGRVVHSEIIDVDQDVLTYRTGLEFVDPSERIRAAIAEFVATARADRNPA